MDKSYLKYSKTQLINLNYSLKRELIRTSRNGAYSSSTIIGCNTRKYHGLLVSPQEIADGGRHVLLSNVDETLIINDSEFHLSSRIFPGGYIHPKGHKYIRDFSSEPNMKLSYRIGKTVFEKEYIFVWNESRLLLKYTVKDSAADSLTFRISPLLAYRSIHALSKSNLGVNNKYLDVPNGISWQMYEGYSRLFFQVSKKAEYTHNPDWHFNICYPEEQNRAYEHKEDLFVPGFFELNLKKGESVIISVGLEEKSPKGFKKVFSDEVNKRVVRNNYENCLLNAAEGFLINRYGKKEVMAGYHWYGRRGRDTFISLPGLCLSMDRQDRFTDIMDTMLGRLKNGLFPNLIVKDKLYYHSLDTSFWFFWALHKFHVMTDGKAKIWKNYGKEIKKILEAYLNEESDNLRIAEDGLIWMDAHNKAVSWMDSEWDGKAVIHRGGFLVEVNALWYDAICFFLEQAKEEKDQKFIKKWKDFPEKIKQSFIDVFWDEKLGYLADYVDQSGPDSTIRPNMLFAISERYSPLSEYQKDSVLKVIHDELLTPKGLRTLSPKNRNYKGKYEGDQQQRELAYHQGTVWPWLLGSFSEAYLKLHPKTGKSFVEKLYLDFEKEMLTSGIGSISEIYDGNPPFKARGAISQAISTGELLRIKWMLDNLKKVKA